MTTTANAGQPYPTVPSSPALPVIEAEILAKWERDKTFQSSVDQRDAGVNGANEYVFYDGPPFANGLPHYGHLLTGYVKDAVPRYQTMRGHKVRPIGTGRASSREMSRWRRCCNMLAIARSTSAKGTSVRAIPRVQIRRISALT